MPVKLNKYLLENTIDVSKRTREISKLRTNRNNTSRDVWLLLPTCASYLEAKLYELAANNLCLFLSLHVSRVYKYLSFLDLSCWTGKPENSLLIICHIFGVHFFHKNDARLDLSRFENGALAHSATF